ncbi:glycosyltransferase family 2 protein, partial [Candidatus Roizmanbacteria bacterium]|nr:glycosyltransferase family 2 protein [Candidatus Roizmanbacteria bacterium]
MKKNNGIVSIIIPTKNSAFFLESCLNHIRQQTYPRIEIVIVDGKSTDNVKELAKKYRCEFYTYVPRVKKGVFDAPHKRNYGANMAKGEYVYWLDADMELPKNLIKEAVHLCKNGADALILAEDSYGVGMWAKAKQLERRCYWNDNSMESPRFFKKTVWDSIEGFDLSLGAGGDDLDLSQKLLEKGYTTKRARNIVLHNEGDLSIVKSFKKHFMYGREMFSYLKKRPKSWITSYNPFKPSYFRHWRLFLANPLTTLLFIIFRSAEYLGGLLGFLFSFFEPKEKSEKSSEVTESDYSDYLCQYYDTKIPGLLKKYLESVSFTSLL